jgi:ATP-dependent DNA helicase PIF1
MTLAPMNQEQANTVWHLESTEEHTFITGKAGTGKTHVLRHFQASTRKKIVVVAPTGVAALNAGGATIHRLLGLNTGLPADLVMDYAKVRRTSSILMDLDTIVIDEISMVSSDLIDSMDRTLQAVRGNSDPFGGLQIIMFGDPYQLPPVVSREDEAFFAREGYRSPWFFHAKVWEYTPFTTFGLQTIHRQSDTTFKDILNGIRDGSVTEQELKDLNAVGSRKRTGNGVLLASRRAQVKERNTNRLRALESPLYTYKARVNTGFGRDEPADRELKLKAGAHVMLLSNDRQDRWVNGTRGVIEGCTEQFVSVTLEDGMTHTVEKNVWVPGGTLPGKFKDAPKYIQLPLKLAWGMTIHKSQGLSLSEIEVDLGYGAFSAGQAYVALSRVTTPQGLYINTPLTMRDVKVDPHVRDFFANL